MKKTNLRKWLLALVLVFGASFCFVGTIFAEGEDENKPAVDENGTSISLSPVSNILSISSNEKYNASFDVKNDGKSDLNIEVYAAPYSYIYSEEEDAYKLGFTNENNFTQIARWIKFKNSNDEWATKANYSVPAGKTLTIDYRIDTPNNIPAGGQYAVIFAHTLTNTEAINGIRTEASPGIVIYGRSTEGEAVISAEISDLEINQSVTDVNGTRNNFFASAKVKNTGNIDFTAKGTMRVDAILGGGSYETDVNGAHVSVIPEAELTISDEWENSPGFGLYRVTWTVTAGEESEVVEKLVLVNPLLFILICIIILTLLVIWIIIGIRKRKERRARLAV